MNVRDMMYVSLFAAIVGVLAFFPPIPIPFIPVPITAQTIGVMLAGSVLGARRGGLSMLLFVLLVAVGAPLMAGGRGGLGTLIGPSGGYVLAWPLAAWVIGYLTEKSLNAINVGKMLLFNFIGGILVIHTIGILYLAFAANLPVSSAAIGNLVFIPGDLVKVVVVSFFALKINQAYPLMTKEKSSLKKSA